VSTVERPQTVELQELRLTAPDTDGTVARLVAGSHRQQDAAVPLLTSIEEQRDVAILRAVGDDGAAETARELLAPFVSTWQTPRRYRLRMSERSQSPPTYYRLAVTESGINDTQSDSLVPRLPMAAGTPLHPDLLWIGSPLGTHAGLLVLLGGRDDEPRADAADWPLPMSRALGVRIYDNRA
jgi:hypothetical protein